MSGLIKNNHKMIGMLALKVVNTIEITKWMLFKFWYTFVRSIL